MLNMGPRLAWKPPIVMTVAARRDGLGDLLEGLDSHRSFLESSGEGRAKAESRLKDEAADLVGEWARAQARRLLDDEPELSGRLLKDRIPYSAAEEILSREGGALVPKAARAFKARR